MAGMKRKLDTDSDIEVAYKELDNVSCPICMDHPHNAVLMRCSSHEKGCTSYICDTSYRHSNCLDRFKKQRHYSSTSSNVENNNQNGINSAEMPEGPSELDFTGQQELQGEAGLELEGTNTNFLEFEGTNANSSESGFSLRCPLCRGEVLGWDVVEEARKYMNSKKRSCSRESCSFSGNYQELRRHARRVHPTTRPSDVDPSRERAWRCLERQREYGDIVSAVRSAMPGAVVVGDYVIENGGVEREGGGGAGGEVGSPWLTTFLLFQMIGSADGGGSEPRARSRPWTRNRRAGGALPPERRFLWGENLLGLQDDDDDDDISGNVHVLSDVGDDDDSPVPRRRRRLNRSRSDDQS